MTHPVLALLSIGLSICIVLRWQSTGPWTDFFQLIILAALSMKVLAWIIWASLWEGWEWVEDDDDEYEDEEREIREYWRMRDEEEMSGMVGSVIDGEEGE
ncbi:hypothetical protein V499_02762 [Pseudogymnoascus sp. VKM F-103]|uniref:Uncharacterized protein n=1 Tax=Pseudogymnoascus verrucosus TaxID=342668 RepID=A0A1B8G923_9PEZI|nr:uncharacterized protein VE01_09426 [Pseudogymnoascus verrucosus]KFY77992.1 hypothetical protein V499_02762 [Pseudogymnoascus sp. VKM F-103]OBT92325.1 hypothetical protein VE01_09426 [Pseudogymnoascus verrucosus]